MDDFVYIYIGVVGQHRYPCSSTWIHVLVLVVSCTMGKFAQMITVVVDGRRVGQRLSVASKVGWQPPPNVSSTGIRLDRPCSHCLEGHFLEHPSRLSSHPPRHPGTGGRYRTQKIAYS